MVEDLALVEMRIMGLIEVIGFVFAYSNKVEGNLHISAKPRSSGSPEVDQRIPAPHHEGHFLTYIYHRFKVFHFGVISCLSRKNLIVATRRRPGRFIISSNVL